MNFSYWNRSFFRWFYLVALQLADDELKIVAPQMGRKFSGGSNLYVANLLRRNFHQITATSSVYAIGTLEGDLAKPSPSLNVSGGTAWACQLFASRQASLGSFNLYFFDQTSNEWHQCEVSSLSPRCYRWNRTKNPPTPGGVYTGIGSRDLTDSGRQAIENLYRY